MMTKKMVAVHFDELLDKNLMAVGERKRVKHKNPAVSSKFYSVFSSKDLIC